MKKIITILITTIIILTLSACSEINLPTSDKDNITETIETDDIDNITSNDWGSMSALDSVNLTVEEMLVYAIEDEFTARSEYEYIISNFEVTTPFTNIIEAEKSHIEMILPFLETFNISVPFDESSNHLIIPVNLEETFSAGIQAEILNISMYNMFLEYELPEDVIDLFTSLRDASIKHLSTFERNLEKL